MVGEVAENFGASGFDGEEVNPGVIYQASDVRVAADGEAEVLARGLDEDAETERVVEPFLTVVKGLHGQTGAKIAAVSEADAEGADDVVKDFVAAAEEVIVHG